MQHAFANVSEHAGIGGAQFGNALGRKPFVVGLGQSDRNVRAQCFSTHGVILDRFRVIGPKFHFLDDEGELLDRICLHLQRVECHVVIAHAGREVEALSDV